jgi:hypothetical protein
MVRPCIHTVTLEKVPLCCTAPLPSLLVLSSQLPFFFSPSSQMLQPIPHVAQPHPRFAHHLALARTRPVAAGRFRIRSGVSWRRISGRFAQIWVRVRFLRTLGMAPVLYCHIGRSTRMVVFFRGNRSLWDLVWQKKCFMESYGRCVFFGLMISRTF